MVLVAPGLSDDELTDVSKGLVARFPESSFRIFDDGSQMELYLEWRRNPNVEEVAKPAVWIGDHHVATIRRIRTEQGLELQLRGGPAHPTQPGRKISSLGS